MTSLVSDIPVKITDPNIKSVQPTQGWLNEHKVEILTSVGIALAIGALFAAAACVGGGIGILATLTLAGKIGFIASGSLASGVSLFGLIKFVHASSVPDEPELCDISLETDAPVEDSDSPQPWVERHPIILIAAGLAANVGLIYLYYRMNAMPSPSFA